MTVVARPPSSVGTVKVLLIDPCVVMREGLCALIARQPDLVVVAQADGVRGAADIDVTPDVIVTDVDLPDRAQREAISGLRSLFPHSAILVLSMDEQPATVDAALAAGAGGYVLKTASSPELFRGIRALAAGQTYMQPRVGFEMARWHGRRDRMSVLSPAEEHVLRLLALGHTNVEIAELSHVSLRTVEAQRARIHQKLGHRTRAELFQHAREFGLLGLNARSAPSPS
jgi:two-component system, NarL family, response regulator NreC